MKFIAILLAIALPALGANVTLEWNPNSEPNLTGYKVYWGTASRTYTQNNAAAATTHTITNLPPGVYYFAVTALAGGLESDLSAEVAWTNRPAPPVAVRITLQAAGTVTGPWTNTQATVLFVAPPEPYQSFYRAVVTYE